MAQRFAGVPNMRVQRTRSSPSAPHSPLTRYPLGRLRKPRPSEQTAGHLLLLVLCVGCSFHGTWPRWALKLEPKLHCGMSVHDVEFAAGSKLEALGGRDALGNYYLLKTWSTLWFDFREDGLQSIVATRIVNVKAGELMQRHNLCTGAVTSLVRLYLADRLVGAKVTVDGAPIAERRGQQAFDIDLVPGRHEIEVAKSGRAVIKRVDVTLGGPGEIRLNIDESDLMAAALALRKSFGAA